MANRAISRRTLLKGSASAAFGFYFVPRHVLGGPGKTAASDKLNVAGIGVGGKGHSDVRGMAGENIVALCDVDERRAARAFKEFPDARRFKDYRVMLEKMAKDIDVVTVSTPDHHHAPASLLAMELGKHVFCQKPLTHSVYEARLMSERARQTKLATIMGIQGHCSEAARLTCEMIWAGLIGDVKEVHYWTNRPIWPQGIDRPTETQPVPAGLHWDLWLGPAPVRPYHEAYVPFKWRGWWDFGTGAMGDIGCHAIAAAFWALNLGQPGSIEAETSPVNNETAPKWSVITYQFPAGTMPNGKRRPAIKLTWSDGGKIPPRPAELEEGRKMGSGGHMIVGTNGTLFNGRIIPDSKFKDLMKDPPPKTLPRSPGIYQEFIRACKGGEPTVADFKFSGALTEMVLAGNLAVRTGKKILWDGPNMRCTNVPEANQYVRRQYRKGWTL
ncbi:MAG: Gfo/Idh/MocA family oxidoreductase [Phycisphaerae bacterium]